MFTYEHVFILRSVDDTAFFLTVRIELHGISWMHVSTRQPEMCSSLRGTCVQRYRIMGIIYLKMIHLRIILKYHIGRRFASYAGLRKIDMTPAEFRNNLLGQFYLVCLLRL